MKSHSKINKLSITFFLLTLSLLTFATTTIAQESHTGWEKDSEYNKLYNNKEKDRLKGVVTKFITVTPLDGMSEGTALLLDEGDGEKITVHLCPQSYADARDTGIRKGADVKIKGSWAVIGDEDIFMAAKVKQGENYEFKVRLTSDGTPFWTMSPEQLAKEKE